MSGNVDYGDFLKSHILLWVNNFKQSKKFKNYLSAFNRATVQLSATLVGDWNGEELILLVS